MIRVLSTLAILAFVCFATSAQAEIIFSSRAAFEAMFPGLPTEDFEEANVAVGSAAFFNGPLSSTTNNGIFAPGDILDNLVIRDRSFNSGGMNALGAGVITGTSRMVGNDQLDTFDANTQMLFLNNSANTIGFDMFAARGSGSSTAGRMRVSVSGVTPGVGETYIVNLAQDTGAFFGIHTGNELIDQIELTYLDSPSQVEFVDNISFGVTTAVPEPSTLIALSTLGIAMLIRRRALKR
ncbi:MAG: PEP-CTERM sorting domain-containing protein [Planctomycetaceae bacterium]